MKIEVIEIHGKCLKRNLWSKSVQYKSVVRGACWFSPSGDYLLHI